MIALVSNAMETVHAELLRINQTVSKWYEHMLMLLQVRRHQGSWTPPHCHSHSFSSLLPHLLLFSVTPHLFFR